MKNSLQPPQSVLAQYPFGPDGLAWSVVGGGFSGAEVRRGDDANGTARFALKAWPPEVGADRVARVQAWLTQLAHLPFVPAVVRTAQGTGFVVESGRVWECTTWKPGFPRGSPTVAEVELAFAAVARLHHAWQPERIGPCPGVLNRLRALRDFRTHFCGGLGFSPPVGPALHSLLRRGWEAVTRLRPWAERVLRPWEGVPLPLRPCVRDLRGEHVLFADGAVSGIVDYGAAAVDHGATDLARLLTDVAWEDEERVAAGLQSYRTGGGPETPEELVRVLAKTGVPCSIVGWLVRLLVEQRSFANETTVADRLSVLVRRLEWFTPE